MKANNDDGFCLVERKEEYCSDEESKFPRVVEQKVSLLSFFSKRIDDVESSLSKCSL